MHKQMTEEAYERPKLIHEEPASEDTRKRASNRTGIQSVPIRQKSDREHLIVKHVEIAEPEPSDPPVHPQH